MIVKEVSIDGYKNLKDIKLKLNPSLNIFCGENAQGKTNLIEAIWLCSGCKSFRGTRDRDFIGFLKDQLEISLDFEDSLRPQNIKITVNKINIKDKRIFLNGVKIPLLSRLFGSFKCVIFTPEDLELVKGSPENRRNFIDLCISQIKPSYLSALNKYDNLVSQRNALLKEISFGVSPPENLEIWDEQLAKTGSYISVLRYNFIKKLEIFSKKLYLDISSNKEELSLFYNSSVFKTLENRYDYNGEMYEEYLKALKNSVNSDIKSGFTGVGIHRDDLIFKINNRDAREFGSQGQQRSIALISKLSQAQILKEEIGDSPVILLDDVLSELDLSRQKFVLSAINGMQIFITCCDSTNVLKNHNGSLFFIKDGSVSENKSKKS